MTDVEDSAVPRAQVALAWEEKSNTLLQRSNTYGNLYEHASPGLVRRQPQACTGFCLLPFPSMQGNRALASSVVILATAQQKQYNLVDGSHSFSCPSKTGVWLQDPVPFNSNA